MFSDLIKGFRRIVEVVSTEYSDEALLLMRIEVVKSAEKTSVRRRIPWASALLRTWIS